MTAERFHELIKLRGPMENLIRNLTNQSNFEFTSNENVDSIGVIASSAVCHIAEHKQ